MQSIRMSFPEGKKKALTFSYDDGVEQDIHLMEVLKKNNLKCTFNLNSGEYSPEGTVFPEGHIHRRMTEKAAVALYKGSGMEVAVHGLNHPWFTELPENVCNAQISLDRFNLEKEYGQIVRGCAYPFGTYNDSVVDILKKNGIVYSRTVNASHDFSIPRDWLRLEPTCHHADPELPALIDRFINETPGIAENPWLFYIWGHSYEFEQFNCWEIIEKASERLGNRDDVWYATNIEVYDYVKAFENLLFSADMSMVQNNSCMDVYFEFADYGNPNIKKYMVSAGQTLLLN